MIGETKRVYQVSVFSLQSLCKSRTVLKIKCIEKILYPYSYKFFNDFGQKRIWKE